MIQLPLWMTGEVKEAWEEYVAQRAKDKKAMTPRSMKGRLAELEKLIAAGYDAVQCIDCAINGHWLDFYAPQEKQIHRAPGRDGNEALAHLDKLAASATKPPAQVLELARRMKKTG